MFRNRIRYGAEGATVGGLFPLAGKTLQQAYKWGARPVGEPLVRMGFNVAGAGFKGASWLLSKNPVLHSQISKSLIDSTKYNVKKMISPMLAKMGYKCDFFADECVTTKCPPPPHSRCQRGRHRSNRPRAGYLPSSRPWRARYRHCSSRFASSTAASHPRSRTWRTKCRKSPHSRCPRGRPQNTQWN